MSARVLPPPLFDLDSAMPDPRPITRRAGHAIRAHNAPGRWFIACTCGDHSPVFTHPDGATKWVYAHLDVVYDSEIDEAVHA